jgi:dTMP kinase
MSTGIRYGIQAREQALHDEQQRQQQEAAAKRQEMMDRMAIDRFNAQEEDRRMRLEAAEEASLRKEEERQAAEAAAAQEEELRRSAVGQYGLEGPSADRLGGFKGGGLGNEIQELEKSFAERKARQAAVQEMPQLAGALDSPKFWEEHARLRKPPSSAKPPKEATQAQRISAYKARLELEMAPVVAAQKELASLQKRERDNPALRDDEAFQSDIAELTGMIPSARELSAMQLRLAREMIPDLAPPEPEPEPPEPESMTMPSNMQHVVRSMAGDRAPAAIQRAEEMRAQGMNWLEIFDLLKQKLQGG